MKPLIRGLIAVVGLISVPVPTYAADVDFGVKGGIYTDIEEPFVGVEALTRVGASRWFFNPNVEAVLVNRGSLATINGDVHYDLPIDTPDLYLWLGGGPALIYRDPGGRQDDDFDIGANLLAGLGWQLGGAVPYVQGKILVADDSEAVLAVGIRF